MRIQWNKVTWYSKILAVVLFLAIFIIGIFLGTQIQLLKDINSYYLQRAEYDSMSHHPIDLGSGPEVP